MSILKLDHFSPSENTFSKSTLVGLQVCRGQRVTWFEERRLSVQIHSILLLRILIRAPTEQPLSPLLMATGPARPKSARCLRRPPLDLDITMKCFWSTGDQVGRSGAISGWIALVVAKDDLKNYLTRPPLLFQNVIEGIESPVQLPN